MHSMLFLWGGSIFQSMASSTKYELSSLLDGINQLWERAGFGICL